MLVARCVVAAAFCALLLHTLVYAAFLEDPLTWTLLAMAAALRRVEPEARGAGFAVRSGRPGRSDLDGFLPCLSCASPVLRDRGGRRDRPPGRGRRGGCIPRLPPAGARGADAACAARAAARPRPAPPPPKPKPKPKPKPDTFQWRHYGYSLDHRRWFNPPDRRCAARSVRVWTAQGPGAARVPARDRRTGRSSSSPTTASCARCTRSNGKTRWQKKLGRLAASSPALDKRPDLRDAARRRRAPAAGGSSRCSSATGTGAGRGRCRAAASPRRCVDDGRLYFGSENGTLYCLRRAHRQGQVDLPRGRARSRAARRYADGKLYFGDYGGHVQAVRASNGHRVWRAARRRSGAGQFYATAAVAFGRVYIGNTDGRVYAFSTRNGHRRLVAHTGSYVYASAGRQHRAARRRSSSAPTTARFYALDARTSGSVRWSHDRGGRISGSPTVIGNIVYFADLGHRQTIGLWTKSGRRVFHRGSGAYDPVISDGKHLYLTAHHTLTALRPRKHHRR